MKWCVMRWYSMSRDADITRLQHMVEAVQEILEFTQGGILQSIVADRPLQHLIVRDLEILGEAASRISPQYRQEHPEIPWRDMIDLRNRLIHAYFDLNPDVIWKTVQQDLPKLLPVLKIILEGETSA